MGTGMSLQTAQIQHSARALQDREDEAAMSDAPTVTRNTLRDAVAARCPHLSRGEIRMLVDAVFDEIMEALANGENVKLHEFGAFLIRKKVERLGRNPKSGVPAPISARRSVTFRPGGPLKAAAEQAGQREETAPARKAAE